MKDRRGAEAVGWKVRHVLQPGFFLLHTGWSSTAVSEDEEKQS